MIMVWREIAQWRPGRRAQHRRGSEILGDLGGAGELPGGLQGGLQGRSAGRRECAARCFLGSLGIAHAIAITSQGRARPGRHVRSDQGSGARLADANTLPQSLGATASQRFSRRPQQPAGGRRRMAGHGTSLPQCRPDEANCRCVGGVPIPDNIVCRRDRRKDAPSRCSSRLGRVIDSACDSARHRGFPRRGQVLGDPTQGRGW